jgi:hypothetical protein
MNAFIFVAVVCMGNNQCEFIASNKPISLDQCHKMEKQLKQMPFKPEVTLAATQCMAFEGNLDKVRI